MSYNLKCCSFYPNNFDASALDRDEHTQRPKCADLSAPTTYHPLLKKAQFFKAEPFFVRTELSQVYYGLAKVQFLKKATFYI